MRDWWRRAKWGDEVPTASWKPWSEAEVVDVGPSAFVVRTYLEQQTLRRYLEWVAAEIEIRDLADVGAGYGRLSLVLREFGSVVAFERETEFVGSGRELLPWGVEFREIRALTRLPAEDDGFDFVLTFTVLQHSTNAVAAAASREIKRLVRPGGFVLLCEETDEDHRDGDLEDPDGRCTIGRSVERYRELMAPLDFIQSESRRVEPTYPRPDVGTYMLFRRQK
jgi:SAM-dependent methyltransferase